MKSSDRINPVVRFLAEKRRSWHFAAISQLSRMRTRLLSVVRNWAFWLLFVVALSLSIILGIADLRAVVFPSGAIVLACAVIVAWIFVLSHAIGPTFTLMSKRKRRESRD
jgi:hypothetical protein